MENVVSFPNYLIGVLCSSCSKYYEQLAIMGFNASFVFDGDNGFFIGNYFYGE